MRWLPSLVLACALAAGAAPSAGVNVVATVAYRYVPGDDDIGAPLRIEEGSRLVLVNLDPLGTHNLVALEVRDGAPLFDSGEQTMLGEMSEVEGVAHVAPGDYPFYCSVHGFDSMNGILEVR